jgi:hypothetical protein
MKDRSFFCSELVAKAYKQMNLLKNVKKSCTQYFPACFEQGGEFDKELIEGVSLGPEINVLVNRREVSGIHNIRLSQG